MASDNPAYPTQAELLYQYLGERISRDECDSSVADLLVDFGLYCQERDKLRDMLLEAEQASTRGESTPLDLEDVIRRGHERFSKEGDSV